MKQDEKLLRDCFEVLKAHAEPNINVELVKKRIMARLGDQLDGVGSADPYFPDVLQFVLSTGNCSMYGILREFWIGYRRIAHIQKALEETGIILPFGQGLNPDYKVNLKVVSK